MVDNGSLRPMVEPASAPTPSQPVVPSRPPSVGELTLATIMRGTEANLIGTIHGGEIVKLADSAAGIVATRFTGGPVVTAAIDEMVFLHPVRVGDYLQISGRVNWAGRTSVEVGVRIESQTYGDADPVSVHVASAYLVMVGVDADGRPRAVPGLDPQTPEDLRRYREAEIRRTHRLARKREIEETRGAS
jgi:acyl-CoA hydrolase